MPSAKRERQREGRQVRVAAAMAEQKRRQRFRTVRNFGILVVVIVGVIYFLSLRSGDDKKPVATTSSSSGSSSAPASVSITVPAPGASITGDTACPAADGSSARTTTFAKAPPMCIDPTKTYTAAVDTSKGTFTIALDPKGAPNTVNNFVVLARYHFYDGVAFHRIIPSFVDQVGDATGPQPGTGGPGYTFADELPTDANPYPEGAVAMANNGKANTNGSQWFVVIGSGGSGLGPTYNRLGTIASGLDVAKAINAAGTKSGAPIEEIKVTKVTITES